jgi:hypothetical protein
MSFSRGQKIDIVEKHFQLISISKNHHKQKQFPSLKTSVAGLSAVGQFGGGLANDPKLEGLNPTTTVAG